VDVDDVRGDSSGSGLGMYIVNELVDNYDGGVSVGDSELGGTRFDVRLLRAE
jgi:signal transduction histidine kinase